MNLLLIPLLVVPPSAPQCQIQGSQDVGSDVILLCSSEEGIPRPTYLWEKLDNTLKLPPTATQGMYVCMCHFAHLISHGKL